MVEAGRARAASLGWPDAYAYTKALGERALVETRGDVPVSIVRPSIIESALAEPCPGWIRGFRMAEPVIISYARGLLKEFPGVPEGIVDVIPVDLVVGADLRRRRPRPGQRGRLARRHPGRLRLGQPAALPSAWSTSCRAGSPSTRSTTTEGQPIVVPEWAFPGRGPGAAPARAGQSSLLDAGRAAARTSLPAAGHAGRRGRPRSRRSASWPSGPSPTSSSTAPTPSARRSTASTACSPCTSRSTPTTSATFCFDPRVDRLGPLRPRRSTCRRSWSTPGCAPTAGGRRRAARRTACARQVLSPDRHLAAFDLENTLIASNVVTSYAWLATRRLPRDDRVRFVAADCCARRRRC